jgi:upstream activation factor subunit UAF30
MGAFYVNVTVRHADLDTVIAALETLGRDAFVAPPHNGAIVVFDAQIETQDARDIDGFVNPLSQRLHCAALAALNHDDDLLYYALLEDGRLVDEYNSRPGYFEGTATPPSGGDARKLAAAFGVPDRAEQVHELLHRVAYTFETERHAALVELLGLPPAAVGSGYETISDGEPPEGVPEKNLRTVGAAALRRPPPRAPDTTNFESEALRARLTSLVQPSPELAAVVGSAPLPYGTVLMKVLGYIMKHGLSDGRTRTIRADAALRAVYGMERLTYDQLPFGLDAHLKPVS